MFFGYGHFTAMEFLFKATMIPKTKMERELVVWTSSNLAIQLSASG